MNPVKSRGIRGIVYDAELRTLDVEFSSSKVYRYFDVPPSVYEWLSRVESKGRFINRLVRDNYRYERIDSVGASIEAGAEGNDLTDALQRSLEQLRGDD